MRKGTNGDYLCHPMIVAGKCMEWGANEDTIIAGLFHDILEDQNEEITSNDIKMLFGENVLRTITECCSERRTQTAVERT